MRGVALLAARAALVAGPSSSRSSPAASSTGPRDVALVVAAVVLLVAAVVSPRPADPASPRRPRRARRRRRLAGWTALSSTWAPVGGLRRDDAERVLLYAIVLAAAAAAPSAQRAPARALEPLAAAGTVVVTGYGLAGRLLPGPRRSAPAAQRPGRLDQPLTYWNATGALAAIGLVLCARSPAIASAGRACARPPRRPPCRSAWAST